MNAKTQEQIYVDKIRIIRNEEKQKDEYLIRLKRLMKLTCNRQGPSFFKHEEQHSKIALKHNFF